MDLTQHINQTTPEESLSLARPVHRLDPTSPDLHHDAALMREHGPVVPVELPGGVTTWAITQDAVARQVVRDTDTFRKEAEHWAALQNGEIPADWPLMGLAVPGRSMVSVDGADHTYLRGPFARVFTEDRVRALRPDIEAIAGRLLDELAAKAAEAEDHVVDLQKIFAWPLPMTVIGQLLGVAAADHPHLRSLFDVFFDDTQDSTSVIAEIHKFISGLIAEKRRNPGADLTSALLQLPPDQQLTDEELVGSLMVVIIAGHETTVHVLVNGVRALTTHPAQLAALQDGTVTWKRAVEEILRWDPPTANFLIRFATRDITVGGVLIKAGEAVMISYIALGRDAERWGPGADKFDITRSGARGHTSFGHGPHVCIGAPLARAEAQIALQMIFDRWPDLKQAAPSPRAPSVLMNARTRLPVRLVPAS